MSWGYQSIKIKTTKIPNILVIDSCVSRVAQGWRIVRYVLIRAIVIGCETFILQIREDYEFIAAFLMKQILKRFLVIMGQMVLSNTLLSCSENRRYLSAGHLSSMASSDFWISQTFMLLRICDFIWTTDQLVWGRWNRLSWMALTSNWNCVDRDMGPVIIWTPVFLARDSQYIKLSCGVLSFRTINLRRWNKD